MHPVFVVHDDALIRAIVTQNASIPVQIGSTYRTIEKEVGPALSDYYGHKYLFSLQSRQYYRKLNVHECANYIEKPLFIKIVDLFNVFNIGHFNVQYGLR